VRDVPLPDLGVAILAVVRLVGQPEPRLRQVHQVPARVLGVGAHVDAEQRGEPLALPPPEHAGERRPVRRGGDLVQQRTQRPDPHRLDPLDRHERRVEVGDLPGLRVRLIRGGLDDRPHVGLGAVAQLAEGAVSRAVVRHLVAVQPAAVDVGEQVVLRADGGVDPAQVEAAAEAGRSDGHTTSCPSSATGVPTGHFAEGSPKFPTNGTFDQ